MKDTGSKILLRSVDEFERLRGTNLAWFGVDELTYTQEGAWLRLEGRLRDPKATQLCGFAVWTPKGFDWVYRKFVQKPSDGFESILAKPFENKFLLEKTTGFLRAAARKLRRELLSSGSSGRLPERERQSGVSARSAGLNVREWSWSAARSLSGRSTSTLTRCRSIVAQSGGDDVQVLDEIVLRRATTEDACEEFVKRFGDRTAGDHVFTATLRVAAIQTTGSSDYEMVREFFAARCMRTSQLPDAECESAGAGPGGRDELEVAEREGRCAADCVDPRCKELIKDLEQVSYRGRHDADRQRQGPDADASFRCAGLSDLAGMPASGRLARGDTGL